MSLKLGELFAGYGGLGMAVEAAFGAELAWVSEIEPAPSKVLAHHFPHAPNLGDITEIDWDIVPRVDILSGGFPCQDVSLAGRRAGLGAGTRTGLWSKFAEAISVLKPKYVVAENVRGLLSAKADSDMEPCEVCVGDLPRGKHAMRALGAVLGDLADLGYDAKWQGIKASDVGAPHQRFRVILLATRRDSDVPYPSSLGDRGRDVAPRQGEGAEPKSEVGGAGSRGIRAGALPRGESGNAEGYRVQGDRPSGIPQPLRLATEGIPDRPGDSDHSGSEIPADTEHNGHSGAEGGGGHREATPKGRDWIPEEFLGEPEVGHTPDSGSREVHPEINWGVYEPAIRRWESHLGRPAPRPTLPTGRNGAERLSAPFVEWMMGLPSGWVTGADLDLSRSDALKMLGNGVVPQQALAALDYLLAQDELI